VLSVSLVLRSLCPHLVPLLLLLLFLFRQLLLFLLFLVLLTTLVSHACSFSAVIFVTASEFESYPGEQFWTSSYPSDGG
jgi:hypothetical protein